MKWNLALFCGYLQDSGEFLDVLLHGVYTRIKHAQKQVILTKTQIASMCV